MSRYMTNMLFEDKEFVERAAKETGFDVKFLDHPMPAIPEYGYVNYYSDNFIGIYGSVYTNEPPGRDHSKFWDAFDRIKFGEMK